MNEMFRSKSDVLYKSNKSAVDKVLSEDKVDNKERGKVEQAMNKEYTP